MYSASDVAGTRTLALIGGASSVPSSPLGTVQYTCRLRRDLEVSDTLSEILQQPGGSRSTPDPTPPAPSSPPIPMAPLPVPPAPATAAPAQVTEAIAKMKQAVDDAYGVLAGGPLPGDAEGQQRARQAAYKAIGE